MHGPPNGINEPDSNMVDWCAQYGVVPADGEGTTEDTCLNVVFVVPMC